MRASYLILYLTLALAGCQTQTASAPPAPSPQQAAPGVTPNTFRMPAGAGPCAPRPLPTHADRHCTFARRRPLPLSV